MNILPEILEAAEDLRRWRRDFHAHPELAFEEHRTAERVAELLTSFGLEPHRGLGGTGVVASLQVGSSERRIGLRADMDALPILEENDFEHRSSNEGVMHACGHDGHTTMLLGAARYLSETRRFDGTVDFIFQPAEEKDGGARAMVEDGLFDLFPAERVFGMHNFPGMEVGEFALCAGPMMAAIDVFSASVRSQGGHAAFPQGSVDNVVIASQIVGAWQTILSRNVDPLESAVLSTTKIHGGDADNVLPAEVTLGGCVRTFTPKIQDLIERRMAELGQAIAEAHGAEFELEYTRYYPATVNTAAEVEVAAAAAAEVGTSSRTDLIPIMGSEDFSYMLQVRPGAFIFAGNGPSAGLHTPRYDFDDALAPVGASYWARLVERELAV
ncbi:MAG: M20 aminoacylase family protein [Acidobacteriota bacterium]